MRPRVVLLVEAAQEGGEIGGTIPRLRGQPRREGAPEPLGAAGRLGTMAGDCAWGRWRALRTGTTSASRARRARACAVKWLPRSDIRTCSSGGRRVSHAARTSGAVTVWPASKRGGPRQWRVHLAVRTSTAIQRRAPPGARPVARDPWRGARCAVRHTGRATRGRRAGAARVGHGARWGRCALGMVRGPQDHLLVMDPPVSLQAGDLRLRRFPLLRQRRRRRRRSSPIRLPGVRRRHVATSGSATIGPGQGRSSSGSRSGVTSTRPDPTIR